jgi:hypothetical protein
VRRGSKEFYELMDAFERSRKTLPYVSVKTFVREHRSVSQAYYEHGEVNNLFIAFMNGYMYAKSLEVQE